MSNYMSNYNANPASRRYQYQQQQQQQQPLPPQAQPQASASTWTSTISSRFATFTKFLTRGSEEDDPDDEDCSHVSNVLRAYYTEKGRPFPQWLPPDPKKPQKQQPPAMSQGQYGQHGQYGAYDNPYGNQYANSSHSRGASGGGGLNDIFGDSRAQQQQPPAPQSLRVPRPSAQSMRSYDNSTSSRPSDPNTLQPVQSSPGPRPLPSQRAGSFQNQGAGGSSAVPVTSRDRLKFRVGGGGSGRNSPAVSSQPHQNHQADSRYAGNPSNDSSGSSYTPASQSWTNTGGYDTHGPGRDQRGYGSSAYQQRPGGPR